MKNGKIKEKCCFGVFWAESSLKSLCNLCTFEVKVPDGSNNDIFFGNSSIGIGWHKNSSIKISIGWNFGINKSLPIIQYLSLKQIFSVLFFLGSIFITKSHSKSHRLRKSSPLLGQASKVNISQKKYAPCWCVSRNYVQGGASAMLLLVECRWITHHRSTPRYDQRSMNTNQTKYMI